MLALDEFIDIPVRQLSLGQRMLIIDHGRKLYDGTDDDIRTRFSSGRVLIAEFSPGALVTLPRDDTGQPLLKELPAGVRLVQAEVSRVWLAFERDAIAAHELVA